MSFRMFRVFCATPSDSESDLEAERCAFHDVIGELNETEAIPEDILFIPVSVVPNITSLIVFQKAVDENVRACEFFIQVLNHTWGPEPRNFEHHYQLATECCQGISILFKVPNGRVIEPAVAQFRESLPAPVDFHGIEDFKKHLRKQLSAWLQSKKESVPSA